MASARMKSSGWVILILPASPANTATFMPAHSASAASSVKSSRPSRAARRCASSSGAIGKGLRRLHRAQRVAVERLARHGRGVDALDRVGHRQAPGSPRRSRRRRRSRARSALALAKGRAASWISTMSGACGASASSPARTEACRVAPPIDRRQESSNAVGGGAIELDVVAHGSPAGRASTVPASGEHAPASAAAWSRRRSAGIASARRLPTRAVTAGAGAAPGGDDDGGDFCHLCAMPANALPNRADVAALARSGPGGNADRQPIGPDLRRS